MRSSDSLQRFLFEHAPIRGEIVHLDATWRAVLDQRDYPPALRQVLGELIASAALLTATLKFSGRLIMQMQGDGPVSLLVVEATSERTLRALAQWRPDEALPGSLAEMVGNGRLAVTIDPQRGRERYQGIVEVRGGTVAEALESYLFQSEQLRTRLWLAADSQRVAGLLLQRLPDGGDDDEDAWPRAVSLTETVTPAELLGLSTGEIVHRLYHEEDIRLFEGEPLSFRCSCSREAVTDVLRMLGYGDVKALLDERGSVSVTCEFCNRHYGFDAVDVQQIFAAPVVSEASPTRH